MLTNVTFEEALQTVNNTFTTINRFETVDIIDAVGRVLAEDILADEFIPGFDRSAMDGFAVIAEDTKGCSESNPIKLKLVDEVLMGESSSLAAEHGCCIYVPTGAEMPQGSDAVVMIEYADRNDDGTVTIKKEVSSGLHYVHRGDDVYPGKKMLSAGRRIKTSDIGTLAAMGICNVPVVAKPIVGIIATGNELVARNQEPGEGQIRDVNSATMDVLVKQAGGIPKFYGIIKDDEAELGAAFATMMDECDMILLSGGSSVGIMDYTDKIISKYGEIVVQGIKIKPGKPTIIGIAQGKPIFGMAGHPVASFQNTQIFVKQTIRQLLGVCEEEYTIDAVLSKKVRIPNGRKGITSVKLHKEDGIIKAEPLSSQSATITALAGADGWLEVIGDAEYLEPDSIVHIHLY